MTPADPIIPSADGRKPARAFQFRKRTRADYEACLHMTVRGAADHLDVTEAAVKSMAKKHGMKFRAFKFSGDGRKRRAASSG